MALGSPYRPVLGAGVVLCLAGWAKGTLLFGERQAIRVLRPRRVRHSHSLALGGRHGT
jgi:hypothetical protein